MAEVSEPHERILEKDEVVRSVIARLQSLMLIDEKDVISRWHRRLEFGYPVPTLGRDDILRDVFGFLDPQQIYSRGRFGAWMYEISNQDHSFMQGVELVNRLTGVGCETTLETALPALPSFVLQAPAATPNDDQCEIVPFVAPEFAARRKDKHG